MKLQSISEFCFFQNVYFTGLSISYIDESTHAKHRFMLEAHLENKIEFLIFASRRKMYQQAIDFFNSYPQAMFFILRDNKIKLCFKRRD